MRMIGIQEPEDNYEVVETKYIHWIARNAKNWTDWAEDLTIVEHDFIIRILADPDFKTNVIPWHQCRDKTAHSHNALHAIEVAISCQHV